MTDLPEEHPQTVEQFGPTRTGTFSRPTQRRLEAKEIRMVKCRQVQRDDDERVAPEAID
jgi:hypothetical protein